MLVFVVLVRRVEESPKLQLVEERWVVPPFEETPSVWNQSLDQEEE